MTTVRQATRRDVAAPAPTPVPVPGGAAVPGSAARAGSRGRHSVADHRRRLLREQLVGVVVLLVLLGVTMALLGMEWLGASAGTSPSAPPPISTTDTGGAP